ncbi:MAG: ParM/StbA family protein [Xenococcaceae cyanobacterium MO_207.B15]|nr:ParM/StbA family protein [Xenococcaceae cyanobacterium MO_207.B15]
MANIYLSIDTGYSDTKAVYRIEGEDQFRYFLMSSKIATVPQAKLDNYQKIKGWWGCPAPERKSWLSIQDQIIVVGSYAEEFNPIDCRGEPKYGTALYKVLAAIGVIVEKHDCSTRKKIKLRLAVLLPCNEYSDRDRFQKRLELICSSYKFREQTIKVKIEKFICHPEGGGLAMARMRLNGKDWFAKQRLGIWMLGNRNLTGLYFEYGDLKVADSPLMGFSYLINDIIDQTSGLTPEKLTSAIFSALKIFRRRYKECVGSRNRPVWSQLTPIKNLATARDSHLRNEEITHIANVIEMVAKEWEDEIQTWLKKVFPPNLTEISISGGPLPFFAPMVEEHFNCSVNSETPKCLNYDSRFVPIFLGAGIVPLAEKALQLKTTEAVDLALSFRLIDCYAVLDDLIASSLEEKEREHTKTA